MQLTRSKNRTPRLRKLTAYIHLRKVLEIDRNARKLSSANSRNFWNNITYEKCLMPRQDPNHGSLGWQTSALPIGLRNPCRISLNVSLLPPSEKRRLAFIFQVLCTNVFVLDLVIGPV